MYEILQIATHLVGVRGCGMRYCNANGGKLQRHFMGVRGYGMMYCNINDGNMQRHFVGVRGHGHDKSVPYGC
ncbi:MAG: hypothetical protein HXN63_00075 [Prevotella pallens]|nr:hypothetical protein [Prevotella pallens]